ncbi:MAG: hypothetical protein HC822_04330 [Oscillochloris sp.]|nr:hypothetical protein [Oscillochloris sp.]
MPIWLIILLAVGGVGALVCIIIFAAVALFFVPQTVETGPSAEVAVTAGPGGIADLDSVPAAGNDQPTAVPQQATTAATVAAPTAAPTNSGSGGIVGGVVGGNTSVNTVATAEAATTIALQQEQAVATAEIEQLYAGANQLFYDEFVDNRNAWFTGVFQEIETDVIEDGVFKVIWTANGSSYELYEVRELTNFIAEVDCLIAQGGPDGSCGIVFGQRNDVGFYKYELFEDYYRLFLVPAEGDPELLVEGDPAGIVRPGEPNNLRVIKRGDEIRLYLNDILLDTINDSSYPTGKVGVSTNSYREEGGVEIWFDNFGVWALP